MYITMIYFFISIIERLDNETRHQGLVTTQDKGKVLAIVLPNKE